MEQPGHIVQSFFERMEARDWPGAQRLLSPSISIEFIETGERFDGANFLAMNMAYPEGWAIEVVETLTEGDRVAAQVRVTHGPDVFWCAGFYKVSNGTITTGREHWVTESSQPAPEWRRPFTST